MISISVCGARGRMGQRIAALINDNPEVKVAGLIESPGHKDIASVIDGVKVTSDIAEGIKNADVVIDFSSPETTMKLVNECVKNNKKLVIGTTGITEEQISKIEEAAEKITVLFSPNMSLGVNLIFRIAKEITQRLPGYEKEIIEAHHNKKVDAPSGTAMKIAEVISGSEDELVFGRQGQIGPRPKKEIGMHVIRGGNIVGEHTVMWISPEERIELTHKAQSRDVFAAGSIKAAIWLNGKSAGNLYSMQDVLG